MGHDDRPLHFPYLPPSGSFTDWFTAHVAMALFTVLRDTGSQRFGRCHAEGCERLFIDLSRNRSRRYCDPKSPLATRHQREHQRAPTPILPKRSGLKPYSQPDLDAIAAELNGRPRKTLEFPTPSEESAEAVAVTR